jgi:DNA-directed RNA polymerase beta subunit
LKVSDLNFILSKHFFDLTNLIKFFNRHRGSQLFDDLNIFSELTHRRKISPFGFGGLLNKQGNWKLRDIHPSQYGRVCLIETVEGESAGLIFSLVRLFFNFYLSLLIYLSFLIYRLYINFFLQFFF